MFKRIKQSYNIATIEETNQFGYRPSAEEIADPDKSIEVIRKELALQDAFKGMH